MYPSSPFLHWLNFGRLLMINEQRENPIINQESNHKKSFLHFINVRAGFPRIDELISNFSPLMCRNKNHTVSFAIFLGRFVYYYNHTLDFSSDSSSEFMIPSSQNNLETSSVNTLCTSCVIVDFHENSTNSYLTEWFARFLGEETDSNRKRGSFKTRNNA